jgi:hypothetical protein
VYAAVGAYVPTNEISGGCLVAGTKIITEDGIKSIEEVTEFDRVLTKEGIFCDVLQTHKFTKQHIYEVTMEDGEVIRCSEDHKFLVNGNWVPAKYISEGMDFERVQDINKNKEKGTQQNDFTQQVYQMVQESNTQ